MWPVGIVIGVVAVAGLALDRGHSRSALARMAAVPVALGAGLAAHARSAPASSRPCSRSARAASTSTSGARRTSPGSTAVVLLALLALAIVPRRAPRAGAVVRPRADRPGRPLGGLLAAHGARRRLHGGAPGRGRAAARRSAPARRSPGPSGSSWSAASSPRSSPWRSSYRRPRRSRGTTRLGGRGAGRPARGHQGPRRQRLRRLPDVALPPARPGRARLRRHLHRRRARAERRHRRASGPAGSTSSATPTSTTPCCDPNSPLGLQPARGRGLDRGAPERRPRDAPAAAGLDGRAD